MHSICSNLQRNPPSCQVKHLTFIEEKNWHIVGK
ncbi:hypothetical protein T01_5163 [Trichinella spiralis]|uniref:Uncharacterized protein n=1 Tax=Trichinella spiralis TaxID=6334 RepID=A0A0V0YZW0_TRISP|nr:hypothetical protein T01_5163 [Trichinella spiralis]